MRKNSPLVNPKSRTARQNPIYIAAFAFGALSVATAVQAEPSVSGNTITWPDDGWYQVQSAETFNSICEGGSSCEVADGKYIVINHSTGQRFENIVVASANTESPVTNPGTEGPESIDSTRWSWELRGNELRFENNGWYQVQQSGLFNRGSYESVCEGVSSCTVEDGGYQIINHSTGEKWQRVSVGSQPISWQQTTAVSGTVFWTDIVYNLESPTSYDVHLNGEFIVNSSGRQATLNNMPRGTSIELAVFAKYGDGTTRLVAKDNFVTEGPSAGIVGYGRPDNTNSFNYAHWDAIPAHLQNTFPSDCMFALNTSNGTTICHSPSTRYLMEFSYDSNSNNGSASLRWEFPLPGENTTNNIEGLAVFSKVGGTGGFSSKSFVLVADITTTFGQSQFEISKFSGNGTFTDTIPILDSVRSSGSTTMGRQINLDGTDLQISTVLAPRPNLTNPFQGDFYQLNIVGEYYEANDTGNVADLSGWTRKGAFLAKINPVTGETVSQEFFPNLKMTDVPVN